MGLALVGKKDGKPVNISIAHIDELTDLESLIPMYYGTIKGATECEAILVSSENNRERAVKILDVLSKGDLGKYLTKVSADLTASTSMAINTKTGEVSVDTPTEDHNLDIPLATIAYMMSSGLTRSSHFNGL